MQFTLWLKCVFVRFYLVFQHTREKETKHQVKYKYYSVTADVRYPVYRSLKRKTYWTINLNVKAFYGKENTFHEKWIMGTENTKQNRHQFHTKHLSVLIVFAENLFLNGILNNFLIYCTLNRHFCSLNELISCSIINCISISWNYVVISVFLVDILQFQRIFF